MTVKIHQVTLLRVLGLGLREEDLHQTLQVHQVPQAHQARVPVQKTSVIGIDTRSAVKSQNTHHKSQCASSPESSKSESGKSKAKWKAKSRKYKKKRSQKVRNMNILA